MIDDLPDDPQAGPTQDANKARIAANVQKMLTKGASESEVEDYLQNGEGLQPQATGTPAGRLFGDAANVHSMAQRGTLSSVLAGKNATDAANATPITGRGPAYRTLEQALSWIPPTRGVLAAGEMNMSDLAHPSTFNAKQDQNYRDIANRQEAEANETPRIFGGTGADKGLPFLGKPWNPSLNTLGAMSVQGPLIGALPGSGLVKGSIAGAVNSLGNSAPDQPVGQTLKNLGINATIGAFLGKASDLAVTGGRAALAPSVDANAIGRMGKIQAQDAVNYPQAELEGRAVGGTTPPVDQILANPKIKPYADAVRATEEFQNADPATVLRESYKLMSERQGKLGRVIDNNDFAAGSTLQNRDIGAMKGKMLGAAAQTGPSGQPAAMPSFPDAVASHAEGMGNLDALQQASASAGRALKPLGNKPLTRSPAAYLRDVPGLTTDQAQAGLEGTLGRLKDSFGFNPLKNANAISRLTPFVDALDLQRNPISGDFTQTRPTTLADFLRGALTTGPQQP